MGCACTAAVASSPQLNRHDLTKPRSELMLQTELNDVATHPKRTFAAEGGKWGVVLRFGVGTDVFGDQETQAGAEVCVQPWTMMLVQPLISQVDNAEFSIGNFLYQALAFALRGYPSGKATECTIAPSANVTMPCRRKWHMDGTV